MHKKTEEKTNHLNAMLCTACSVHQLIAKEKDRDRLIKVACEQLVETRGYYAAWIILADENKAVASTAETGLGKELLLSLAKLKVAEFPGCTQKALAQSDVVALDKPAPFCRDCPLSTGCRNKGTMAVRLEYDKKIYGFLMVSVLKEFAGEEKEKDLLKEMVGDISFALHALAVKEEGKKTQIALEDTHQKLNQTQEQLIQSSKMAAMGQLAAGISHELNQPLTGIKGFAQAGLMKLEENNSVRYDLNKIVEQSDRMDKIIQNIRLFARKSEFKMEELDINKPIEDSLMLLGEQFKLHNICLKKSLAKRLPKIKGNANELQQVFLNLLTNARDSVNSLKDPERGEVIVETSLSKDKKNIEAAFIDTGRGITKKDLKNIFNPFFTTKSPDGGMGLGLSIVYRIVESHQGKIEVESKEDKKTSFRITLPIVKGKDESTHQNITSVNGERYFLHIERFANKIKCPYLYGLDS